MVEKFFPKRNFPDSKHHFEWKKWNIRQEIVAVVAPFDYRKFTSHRKCPRNMSDQEIHDDCMSDKFTLFDVLNYDTVAEQQRLHRGNAAEMSSSTSSASLAGVSANPAKAPKLPETLKMDCAEPPKRSGNPEKREGKTLLDIRTTKKTHTLKLA